MDRQPELVVPAERGWVRPAVVMPVFGFVSAVAGSLPSFSWSANLLVLGVGGVLFWLGMSRTVGRRKTLARLPVGTLWWMLPMGLLIVVELANFLIGSSRAHPTLSLLADPMLERYLPRSAAFFGWLAAFWALVRR